jgi:hypothetical protein
MYVNSIEGLRVRDCPDVSGNIVGRLSHLDRVLVLESSINIVEIDGIKSKWRRIKTDLYNGWVFGGYLEDTVEKIKNIEKINGRYFFSEYIELKRNNKPVDISNALSSDYYLDVKYLGNDQFELFYCEENDKREIVDYDFLINCLKTGNKIFSVVGVIGSGGSVIQEFSFNDSSTLIYHYSYESQEQVDQSEDYLQTNTLEYRVYFRKKEVSNN